MVEDKCVVFQSWLYNGKGSIRSGWPHVLIICFFLAFVISAEPPCFSQETEDLMVDHELTLITKLLGIKGEHNRRVSELLIANEHLVTQDLWMSLINRAQLANSFANLDQAITIYNIALEVAEFLGHKKLSAITLYNVGLAYSGQGRVKESIKAYLASREAFQSMGLQRDLIYILSDLGAVYFYDTDYEKARLFSEESIGLAEKLKGRNVPAGAWPDQYGVAGALSTLSALYRLEGKFDLALKHATNSLSLYEELNKDSSKFSSQIADSYAIIGRIYRAMGDNNRALLYLNRALDLARNIPYRSLLANILNSIGYLYLEQEAYQEAKKYLDESLEIFVSQKNQTDTAMVLLNLGVVEQRQGNLEQALVDFQKSLEKATAISNKDVMIAAGEGIGAIHIEKKDYAAAFEILEKSHSLALEIADQNRIAEVLWRKAELYYANRSYAEAEALSENAYRIAREFNLSKLSYLTAMSLGQAYLRQGKADLAQKTLTQAIDQIEELRDQVAGKEQGRQLFFEKAISAYHSLIELYIEQNRPMDALLNAERAKGRALLDILSYGRTQITKTLSREEIDEDAQLKQRIVDLNNEVRYERSKKTPNFSWVAYLNSQLKDTRLKYATFHNTIYAIHRDLKIQRGQIQPLSPDNLTDFLREHNTALLEFIVTRERTYLFVITRKPHGGEIDLKAHQIDVSEDQLTCMVNQFHNLIANRDLMFVPRSRELYDLLLGSAEPQLMGVASLCIIPDGILWDLPFQALRPRTNRYLLEDYSIYFAPSLNVLQALGRKAINRSLSRSQSLLAFGNPIIERKMPTQLQDLKRGDDFDPLPDAETEVKMLGKIFGPERSRVLIGSQAGERSIKEMVPAYTTIHFATHGVLDNLNPLYSYLLLSTGEGGSRDDGLLEAREIMDLDLQADLVVLSACETARGRIGAGEGVIGMSWALFVAGCTTTVVSQWKVNSASTSDLMINFYNFLSLNTGHRKRATAEALRMAAIKLMKDRRYRHPYYWSGFVVIGINR